MHGTAQTAIMQPQEAPNQVMMMTDSAKLGNPGEQAFCVAIDWGAFSFRF